MNGLSITGNSNENWIFNFWELETKLESLIKKEWLPLRKSIFYNWKGPEWCIPSALKNMVLYETFMNINEISYKKIYSIWSDMDLWALLTKSTKIRQSKVDNFLIDILSPYILIWCQSPFYSWKYSEIIYLISIVPIS